MRSCQICGSEMRVLFPLHVGTAVRWACEWCIRDQSKKDRADLGLPDEDNAPGDPDEETHWGKTKRGQT